MYTPVLFNKWTPVRLVCVFCPTQIHRCRNRVYRIAHYASETWYKVKPRNWFVFTVAASEDIFSNILSVFFTSTSYATDTWPCEESTSRLATHVPMIPIPLLSESPLWITLETLKCPSIHHAALVKFNVSL